MENAADGAGSRSRRDDGPYKVRVLAIIVVAAVVVVVMDRRIMINL